MILLFLFLLQEYLKFYFLFHVRGRRPRVTQVRNFSMLHGFGGDRTWG